MSKLRDKIKTGAWLLGSACVDALIAGGTAAVVPITMINPVIGCMIVTGSAVAAGALGDRVIKPWVDEMVDNAADELTEESMDGKPSVKEAWDVMTGKKKAKEDN